MATKDWIECHSTPEIQGSIFEHLVVTCLTWIGRWLFNQKSLPKSLQTRERSPDLSGTTEVVYDVCATRPCRSSDASAIFFCTRFQAPRKSGQVSVRALGHFSAPLTGIMPSRAVSHEHRPITQPSLLLIQIVGAWPELSQPLSPWGTAFGFGACS